MIQDHLKWLGHKVQCAASGIKGVVTSISFDLNGCIQGYVNPGVDKDMKLIEGRWIDLKALRKLEGKPVMDQPAFVAVPGASDKGQTDKAPK